MSICWMRWRAAGATVMATVMGAALACGGGGPGGGAKPMGPVAGKAAEEDPFDFCTRYRGSCASEDAARELRVDGEGQPAEAAVNARIEELYAACREKVDGLTDAQREWLDACNGCGGTCDVFSSCLIGIPDEVSEPFRCTQYEQDSAPHAVAPRDLAGKIRRRDPHALVRHDT